MNAQQAAYLEKARASLDAATLLLNQGFQDFSASRAYYSMFYAAEALLLSRGMSFPKHSAVVAAFGKEFAKTKLLPVEMHEHLREAEGSRLVSDYDIIEHISEERVRAHLAHAAEFLRTAERFLQQKTE